MRKVILYIATTIDGFIARENGDIDWLEDPGFHLEGEDFGYNELINSVDATLMGYKTFQQVLSFDVPFPYLTTKNYVFSRSQRETHEHAEMITGDVISFIETLKSQAGKDIWLIGGGELNATLLKAQQIDLIIQTIIPVILGKGIPMFSSGSAPLNLISTRSYDNGFVINHYTPKV